MDFNETDDGGFRKLPGRFATQKERRGGRCVYGYIGTRGNTANVNL